MSVENETQFPRSHHMHEVVPNVVAIAVRMVITMLRIFPQVLLLLNVPIVCSVLIIHCKYSILH